MLTLYGAMASENMDVPKSAACGKYAIFFPSVAPDALAVVVLTTNIALEAAVMVAEFELYVKNADKSQSPAVNVIDVIFWYVAVVV
jgi:hypothetical protein